MILTVQSKEIGVTMTPRKLPKIELMIAAVSLPLAALVRITALDTGGGMHATVNNLKRVSIKKKKRWYCLVGSDTVNELKVFYFYQYYYIKETS